MKKHFIMLAVLAQLLCGSNQMVGGAVFSRPALSEEEATKQLVEEATDLLVAVAITAVMLVAMYVAASISELAWSKDRTNSELFAAIANEDPLRIQQLLKKGADVSATDSYGFTPLHWVALLGYKNIVIELIKQGADVNDKDLRGCTPLHRAVRGGHKGVATELMRRGADPYIENKMGKTPLDKTKDEMFKKMIIGAWERRQKTIAKAGEALKEILPREIVDQEIMKWVYPSEISGKEE